MMGRMLRAFTKKLFGADYGRVKKSLLVWLVVFWGLYRSGIRVEIAPRILYLMVSVFTAGVMWQALSAEDNGAYMQNMFMLPFERRQLVLSYTAALGTYTFLTKTAGLLTVVCALAVPGKAAVLGCVLCAGNAILLAACGFAWRKYWYVGILWASAAMAMILLLWDSTWFLLAVMGNGILAFLLLQRIDGYAFYVWHDKEGVVFSVRRKQREVKGPGGCLVWHYLFRYLKAHKNYAGNMAVIWGVAFLLPFMFETLGTADREFAVPIGFAILSVNTPVCILLSCDPSLEQAVRFLPGQGKAFCVPYCLFIFLCNMAADLIFLGSFQIQSGGVTCRMVLAAGGFALFGAVCSALLEWFCPVRGWKIESDLWHHPRKYVVPVAMLLLVGILFL